MLLSYASCQLTKPEMVNLITNVLEVLVSLFF